MIVISTDTVVVCIGAKRDCQCQIFVIVTKSFFYLFFCVYINSRFADHDYMSAIFLG